MPLRGEGSCGGGGAPRDSAGSGATEEGLTSRGGRHTNSGSIPTKSDYIHVCVSEKKKLIKPVCL